MKTTADAPELRIKVRFVLNTTHFIQSLVEGRALFDAVHDKAEHIVSSWNSKRLQWTWTILESVLNAKYNVLLRHCENPRHQCFDA